MISVKVTRSGRLQQNMENARKVLGRKVEAGLQAVGAYLLERSQELVAKDTHELAMSGHWRQENTGFATQIIVGYGSTESYPVKVYSPNENRMVVRDLSEYTLQVHEGIFKTTTGEPFFLEKPALTELAEMRRVFDQAAITS